VIWMEIQVICGGSVSNLCFPRCLAMHAFYFLFSFRCSFRQGGGAAGGVACAFYLLGFE